MKSKLWLWQVPGIALFTALFYIHQLGAQGDLDNTLLREKVFPTLRRVSSFFLDMKFKLRGPTVPKNKIVILAIDNSSIELIGRWPWHRNTISEILEVLYQEYQPKVVGLDIVFSEPDQRVSTELRDFLKTQKLNFDPEQFETDHALTQTIERHKDNIVLGWTTDLVCQPAYHKSLEECSVTLQQLQKLGLTTDSEMGKRIAQMQKFSFDKVSLDPAFVAEKTPVVSFGTVITNLPEFMNAAKHSGYFNAFQDPDGYIRQTSLMMFGNGIAQPSLPLAMAKVFLDEELFVELNEQSKVKKLGFLKSGKTVALSPLGASQINFHGPRYTFPYLSVVDLFSEHDKVKIFKGDQEVEVSKKELLKDSMVLVGATALGIYDMRAFPFDPNTPGVEGHATILDNILSSASLTKGEGNTYFIVLFILMTLGALGFAFLIEKLESIPALIVCIAVFIGMGFLDAKVLFTKNIHWDLGFLFIELSIIFVSTVAVKYVMEEKNKKFIKGAFSKYVSPAIVESILKDPTKLTVGGEKKDLTILFSDIRSFTTFSEKMDAKQLAKFLNDYLGTMTDLVFKHEGTLDKYIGDAVMAFWGAPVDVPRHAGNACTTAVEMIQQLKEQQARYKKDYGIDVNVGIGLNSGAVNVGNMGSSKIFEYTVIGDSVNLASRIEGLTKYYGASVLTTRFTFDEIAKTGVPYPAHRTIDFVKVKGKKQAVEIIEVLTDDLNKETLELFLRGRELYMKRQWDDAIRCFMDINRILANRSTNTDATSLLYVERCEQFKLQPPSADWDGSWEMTSK